VVLINHGPEPFAIRAGDRIAQLLVQKVERVAFVSADAISETVRGAGGFGSTGR
jgi:dUTP pyrophosphatase